MGLIGHLSNCSAAVAMYVYKHYNYKPKEIIFNIPRFFIPINYRNSTKIFKNCSIPYSDIIEQIFNTKKTHHYSLAQTPEPLTKGHDIHDSGKETLPYHNYVLNSSDLYPKAEKRIFNELLHSFGAPP